MFVIADKIGCGQGIKLSDLQFLCFFHHNSMQERRGTINLCSNNTGEETFLERGASFTIGTEWQDGALM